MSQDHCDINSRHSLTNYLLVRVSPARSIHCYQIVESSHDEVGLTRSLHCDDVGGQVIRTPPPPECGGMSRVGSGFLLRPGKGAEYCDQFVCLCVCLSVREHVSLEPLDRSSRNFFVQMLCGRGSVPILWRRCDTHTLFHVWGHGQLLVLDKSLTVLLVLLSCILKLHHV